MEWRMSSSQRVYCNCRTGVNVGTCMHGCVFRPCVHLYILILALSGHWCVWFMSASQAETRGVPRVENTNVDRSVGLIHMTLLG